MGRAHHPYRRSFTRVELLVVLSILGLLASMLLPVVNRARERSNRIKCASNLKQIGLALNMYSNNERNGSFPRTLFSPGAPLTLTTAGYGDSLGPFDMTTGV